MKFELNRLGPYNFEKMIQSLIQGKEPKTILCGDGPDGQRELFVRDAQFEVVSSQYAQGYTVGQVKYKSPDGKEQDWSWLRKNLKKELDGFRSKKITEPEKVPNTYLFFTNLIMTPVEGSGLRDKAEKLADSYRDLIPNIFIYGADDIRGMLDNNRDVARSYASFLLPGDVLQEMQEYLTFLKCQKMEALIAYARQMFREDRAVHLEQAGGISDKSINIRKVYTDLDVKPEQGEDRDPLHIAAYLIELGDESHVRKHLIPAELRDNPQLKERSSNLLLTGGAGQGKSTVCQYICQIYRASLLKRMSQPDPYLEDYFQTSHLQSIPVPKCERFPMMVSLKYYAAWIQKQGTDGNRSVMAYLAYLIGQKADAPFHLKDLRDLISSFSWLFIFDGLDEVSASSNRSEVLNQIHLFMDEDLPAASCDGIVICTSRPQGLDLGLFSRRFRRFQLQEMSKDLCKAYLEHLLNCLEENTELRDGYRNTLLRALEDKTTSRLMTTPLYTAIVVLLVKAGGTPPKKRYKLFQEYCSVVIKRERQKNLLPAVNGDTEWVEELHAQIGFLLQMESENADNVAAELPALRCKTIIEKYLEEVESDPALTDTIYNAMVARLPFLAEVFGDDGEARVLFPLRSIQEYFAAEWLIRFQDDETRLKALTRISVNVYWRNVYLFVNGHFAAAQYRVMKSAMQVLCRENNGDAGPEIADPEAQTITLQGSRLALDVLQDEPFSQPRDWKPYLELAALLLERTDQPLNVAKRFLALPECYERELLTRVIPCAERFNRTGCIAYRVLWGLADRGVMEARETLETVVEHTWLDEKSDVLDLLEQGYSGVGPKALKTLLRWVTEDCFSYMLSRIGRKHYMFFINHCLQRLEVEEVLTAAARQAAYLWIELVGSDYKVNPKKLNDPVFSEIGKIVSLIHFSGRNLPAECRILEQFQKAPDYSAFCELLRSCYALPAYARDAFLRLKIWKSRVFARVIQSAIEQFSSEEEALSYYHQKRFQDIIERKQELSQLAKAGDVIAFTRQGGWEFGLTAQFDEQMDDEQLIKLLEVAEDHLSDDELTESISRLLVPRIRFNTQAKEWVMEHFDELCSTNNIIVDFLIERIISCTSPREAAFGKIRFPRSYALILLPSRPVFERMRDYLHFVQYQPAMIEAYSLVPFCKAEPEELISLLPKEADNHYSRIKQTGNRLALTGFLICFLMRDLSAEQMEMIREDLTELAGDFHFVIRFLRFEQYSMSGKKLLWKLFHETGSDGVCYCTEKILDDLEHTPIDCGALLDLSKQGHRAD